jgi:ribonucleoside-triphosphate reductase
MLYLPQSYPTEFAELFMHLKAKYPAALFDMEGIGKQTDMSKFSRDFFAANTTADASIDANANVCDTSNIAYNIELPKPFFKYNSYFMLWKHARRLYGHEVANSLVEAQLTGDIYINDFHGIAAGSPYCFNYSTYDIMLGGLPMVDKIKSVAPKYLFAFKSQLEQFVVIASNSTLGAAGLADLLIVMSLYMRRILADQGDAHFKFADEGSCWAYFRETLVSFIYTINQPMRGNQSPFTNISVYDDKFLDGMLPGYIDPVTGEAADMALVKRIQELFLDIMNAEMERTPVTFPVTSACFSVNDELDILDEDFAMMIATKNTKYGFINLYSGKSSTLSSCCRLRSESDNEYFNSFGAGSTKIGSLGVCTINFPRLANTHYNHPSTQYDLEAAEMDFFKDLREMVKMAQRVNHTKRKIVERRIANGNLPLYTLGFMDLSKQYSTLGVNGLNECLEIMGYNILTEKGQAMVLKILEVINYENDKLQKQYKAPHNCEQIPGENSSIKLASKDHLFGVNTEYDIYSNQFIPLTTDADMLDRISLQGLFDKHFSGGAICHVNVEQEIKDPTRIFDLIKTVAKQGVVYWAVNYNIQRCVNDHMAVGKGDSCTLCGGAVLDNFTRVVGFLTNTKNWHKVRREQDYPNRQFYGEI